MAKAVTSPKTEAIKPELLPVDLGGGEITFVKRSDYAKRTAETIALKLKAEIKKAHVEQILDALDAGQTELTGENPAEFVKLFDTVKEDYESAVEEVKRKAQEEADKKANEERAAKEKAEKEEKLFLAVKDETTNLTDLSAKFEMGAMDRFIPKGEVTSEELLTALNTSFGMSDFSAWMQGDLVLELEKRGELNVVSRIAEARGVPYSGLYNKAKTCRVIPPDERPKGVSFTVLSEIANAKFTKEQETAKTALLEEAKKGELTTQTARAKVKEIQGKPTSNGTTVAPEDDEKKVFILVDPNAELDSLVQVIKGAANAKDLLAEGAILIDPKTLKRFAKNGFAKKPENRWEDVSEFTKPEPPKAAATTGGKKGKK